MPLPYSLWNTHVLLLASLEVHHLKQQALAVPAAGRLLPRSPAINASLRSGVQLGTLSELQWWHLLRSLHPTVNPKSETHVQMRIGFPYDGTNILFLDINRLVPT